MFLPQALSGSTPLGLPVLGGPLGAGIEVADHVDLLHALGLMVNEETPMSYLLPLTPLMMLPNFGRLPLGLDAEFGGDLR